METNQYQFQAENTFWPATSRSSPAHSLIQVIVSSLILKADIWYQQ